MARAAVLLWGAQACGNAAPAEIVDDSESAATDAAADVSAVKDSPAAETAPAADAEIAADDGDLQADVVQTDIQQGEIADSSGNALDAADANSTDFGADAPQPPDIVDVFDAPTATETLDAAQDGSVDSDVAEIAADVPAPADIALPANCTVNCDDGNSCTFDLCSIANGCKHLAIAAACSDASVCQIAGTCAGGNCKVGEKIDCDDKNICTIDSCNVVKGCQHAFANGACDDGNPCTSADACAQGVCKGAGGPDCDDKTVCTTDSCEGSIGCVHVNNTATCDDGVACTLDGCVGGKCVGAAKLFSQNYGGKGNDQAYAIAALSDGFALAGLTASKGAGDVDYWLVKTDLAGKVLWDKTYGGKGGDQANALVALNDGFALAGFTTSKGEAGSDFWLVRTDSSGNLLWDKTYGGAGGDVAWSVVALKDGFAVAGFTSSTVDGNYDFWLVRTDAAGEPLFTVNFGGADNDFCSGVVATKDGFVLIGSTKSKGAGGEDAWLVKTDTSGNLLWDKTYGGAKSDGAFSAVVLADGLAVLGATSSKGAGATDFWLIRTDNVGNILWDRTYGGKNNELADGFSLAALGDGFAMAGRTASKGSGGNDFWLVRTDLFGNALWDKTYGGAGDDQTRALAALADGFVVAGSASPITDPKAYDFRVVRTDLWGNTDCLVSGGCFTTLSCDDGNACTADLCDGKSVCSHAKLADGSACDKGACKGGACQ